jgi:hypothetical protein
MNKENNKKLFFGLGEVAHTYYPSYMGGGGGRSISEVSSRQKV